MSSAEQGVSDAMSVKPTLVTILTELFSLFFAIINTQKCLIYCVQHISVIS